MALTRDVHIERYGVIGDATQPLVQPLGGSVTVYRGSIALTDNTGNIKNSASPLSTDTCWGLIEMASPGSGFVDTTAGIVAPSSANSSVLCQIATGTFFLQSGSGSDQLSQSTVGKIVYVINETTVGLTSGGGSRPVAGTHYAVEARTQALGPYAIKLGTGMVGPDGGA